MTQHIGIQRIDEHGKLLERSDINFADVVNMLYKLKDYKENYPLLAYVDPYGDTYLNILQRPDFVEELKRFSRDNNFGDTKELADFISKTGVREYIKFIGD